MKVRVSIPAPQLLFREVIYAPTKDDSVKALEQLKKYCDKTQNEKFLKACRSLNYNFGTGNLILTF